MNGSCDNHVTDLLLSLSLSLSLSLQVTVWTHQESKASNTVIIHFNKKVKCMKYPNLSSTSNEVTVVWEDNATDSAIYVVTVASRQTLEFKTARVPAKKQGTKYSSTGRISFDTHNTTTCKHLSSTDTLNVHCIYPSSQLICHPLILSPRSVCIQVDSSSVIHRFSQHAVFVSKYWVDSSSVIH